MCKTGGEPTHILLSQKTSFKVDIYFIKASSCVSVNELKICWLSKFYYNVSGLGGEVIAQGFLQAYGFPEYCTQN